MASTLHLPQAWADRALWRAGEHAFAAAEKARRWRLERRANARPRSDLLSRFEAGADLDALELERLYIDAVRAGACQTARAVEARLDPTRASISARVAYLERLLAEGEVDAARDLVQDVAIQGDPRGAGLIALMHEAQPPGDYWLDQRTLNAAALSQSIEERAMDEREVWALLASRPLLLLKNPQWHLLHHNAARLQGDSIQPLRRFLRAAGLPDARADRNADNFLARLSFGAARSSSGPLVSVVMSAFNAAATIDYAIRSILSQTHRNLELLICDDQSEDDTLQIARRHAAADSRVRLFQSRQNQGTYNIRNQMIAASRGEYITFQDADDLALPGRIEAQLAALQDGARACIGNWLRVAPDGRFVFFRDQSAVRLSVVSLLAHRTVFAELGPYASSRFGADLDHYETLSAREDIRRLRQPLLFGLWGSGSLTRVAGAEVLESGYRSPARRAYAELIFRRKQGLAVDGEAISRMLRETGNRVEPRGSNEL
jgi:hypothetical protein